MKSAHCYQNILFYIYSYFPYLQEQTSNPYKLLRVNVLNPTASSYSLNFKIWLLGKTVSTQDFWPKAVTILTVDYAVLPSFQGAHPLCLLRSLNLPQAALGLKGSESDLFVDAITCRTSWITKIHSAFVEYTFFFFLKFKAKLLQDDQPTDLCKAQHIAAYFWELRRQESSGSTSQLKYCDTPLIEGATTAGWQSAPHNSYARMYCEGSHTWGIPGGTRANPALQKCHKSPLLLKLHQPKFKFLVPPQNWLLHFAPLNIKA